jgi:hypothetical protein
MRRRVSERALAAKNTVNTKTIKSEKTRFI